ncbi:TPA: O-antigen polymerase [Enterococcus faecium]
MIETKIVGFFYILYTIFIFLIISITSLGFWNLFPSILLMWLIFTFFVLGSTFKEKEHKEKRSLKVVSWLTDQPNYVFIILIVISILFSFLVVRFYTGQTFQTVLNNIKNGISNYAQYQKYFSENQISEFSISKLPFIFMMAFVKFNLFYGSFSLILTCNKIKKLNFIKILYLVTGTCSYLYIGIARGTNFEMFEFVVLIITLILSKSKNQKINLKRIVFLSLIILMSVLIFIEVIGQRGGSEVITYYISRDVFYDANSIIARNFPRITMLLLSVYDYFGFGFYYGAVFLNDVFFSSLKSSLIYTFPLFPKIFNQLSSSEQMKNLVDMGARWNPDQYVFITNFGIICLFLFTFILGVIMCRQKNKFNEIILANDVMINFFIILQMLSFPIGNFIMLSSSSKIIIFWLILYKLYSKIFSKQQYNKTLEEYTIN